MHNEKRGKIKLPMGPPEIKIYLREMRKVKAWNVEMGLGNSEL
jgi:hypothetical protein